MIVRRSMVSLLMFISVLAVTALSCSAVGNLPNPFASATPTATATFTPSVTPSPTATSTPTPTVTPTSTPAPTGVEATTQADGTTLVKDWDNQYEFALPSDWFAFPLTKETLDRIVQQNATQSPEFAKVAEAYKNMDPAIFRAFGLSKDPKYAKASYPTLFIVSAIPDEVVATLPMAAVTAMIEDKVLTGATDTTWDVKHNVHGVEVGIVEGSLKVAMPNAAKQNAKSKVIAFQSNNKLILIEFLTPAQFGAEVLPSLDQIVDTVQQMKP